MSHTRRHMSETVQLKAGAHARLARLPSITFGQSARARASNARSMSPSVLCTWGEAVESP